MTETLTDGRYVIYMPFSLFITFGQVHIIAIENVKNLSMTFKDSADINTRIGFEANKVYKEE